MDYYTDIRECLFNKYFLFKGRSEKREFLSYMLFFCAVTASLLAVATGSGFLGNIKPVPDALLLPAGFVLEFFLFIPLLSVTTRRMHDTGKSGRVVTIMFIVMLLGFFLCLIGFASIQVTGRSDFFAWESGLLLLSCALILAVYIVVQCLKSSDPHDNRFGKSNA